MGQAPSYDEFPEQMKILFLLNSFEHDGPGQLTLDLARLLSAEHGFRCHTAALSRGGPLRPAFEARGIATAVIGENASAVAVARRLRSHLCAGGYDVVHTQLLRADLLGRWVAARAGIGAIFSTEHGIHTWEIWGRRWRPWIARAYRLTARRTRGIVAVSRFVAGQLLAEGIPPHKVHLIHNGVDVGRFRPLAQEEREQVRRVFGVAPQARVVVAAGKMVPLKGHRTLCLALPAVLREASLADVQVLIAGEGPERAPCEELVRQANLGGRARFLGYVDGEAMPGLLGAADLVVQPSRMESFGLTAAEAMACGVAVVASRIGGLPELIEDGREGLLVAPDSPETLSRGLIEALGNPDRLKEMGRAGMDRVRREFDIRRTADAYARLFGEGRA